MNSLILKYSVDLVDYKKLKGNITCEEIKVMNFEEYEEFKNTNFKLTQLRLMCKHFNLKCSGNKKELQYSLYNFLRLSFYSREIQRVFRGHLQRKYNKLHGPAFIKRNLCTNTNDFFTMDKIDTIPHFQFYSYKDKDGFIYGFDILSLYNLIIKTPSQKSIQNPYNRNSIRSEVINEINILLSITKLLGFPINIVIKNETSSITPKKRLELRIVTLFQKINELGNYSDSKWFTDLNQPLMLRFLRELYDIWNYRAQLSDEVKREICPPNGNPFYTISMLHLQNLSHYYLQNLIVSIMETMINTESISSNKHLGSIYILSALCLVNPVAAHALPWLYQSVMHT